jgi:hypothetical protein
MSSESLLPDRQITFSPDLAATIGLEEAILLQGLGNRVPRLGPQWQAVILQNLVREFPFWSRIRIEQLLQRLADLGIIRLLPGGDSHSVRIAIPAGDTPAQGRLQPNQQCEPSQVADHAALDRAALWAPSPGIFDMLAMTHGVDRGFAETQLQLFPAANIPVEQRDSRFRQFVLSAWRRHQADHSAFQIPPQPQFDNAWQPSADALEIMTRAGIDHEFIDSLVAEFVLYWRERGGPPKEVNSRFIAFVRQRWTRYSASLTHSTEPTAITRDWQPHRDVFDILALSGVDESFARQLLPEFILYWLDSNELHTSWNSKFLQHAKHQWQRKQQGVKHEQEIRGGARAGHRTKDRSILDDLTDNTWAD